MRLWGLRKGGKTENRLTVYTRLMKRVTAAASPFGVQFEYNKPKRKVGERIVNRLLEIF